MLSLFSRRGPVLPVCAPGQPGGERGAVAVQVAGFALPQSVVSASASPFRWRGWVGGGAVDDVLECIGQRHLEGSGRDRPGRLQGVDVALHDHPGQQAPHHGHPGQSRAVLAEYLAQRGVLVLQRRAQQPGAGLMRQRGPDQGRPGVLLGHVLPAVQVHPGQPRAHAVGPARQRISRDPEAAHGLHEQGFLAAEVGDDQGLVHAGRAGDVPDRDQRVTVRGEQPPRGNLGGAGRPFCCPTAHQVWTSGRGRAS